MKQNPQASACGTRQMIKEFESCNTDFEQTIADNECLESRYFELIDMYSHTGFFPTKDQWILACREGRVEGDTIEINGKRIMNEIIIT